MILKTFTHLLRVHKAALIQSYPIYNFCNSTQDSNTVPQQAADQQEQSVQKQLEELNKISVEGEDGQLSDNKREYFKASQIDPEQKGYFQVASQFLVRKHQINNDKEIEQIRKLTDFEEIIKKVNDIVLEQEAKKNQFLVLYEKKLGITSESFLKSNSILSSSDFPKITKLKPYSINMLTYEQFKANWESGLYGAELTKEDIRQILNKVISKQLKPFVLNIIFEVPNDRIAQLKNELQVESKKIKQMLLAYQLEEVNILKCCWFLQIVNPQLRSDLLGLTLEELNKIAINKRQVDKQFKNLVHFFLPPSLSKKILTTILEVSLSLEQTIKLWFFTIITLQRLEHAAKDRSNNTTVYLKDILQLNKNNITGQAFFNENLPQILYQFEDSTYFLLYQKGLKQKTEKSTTASQSKITKGSSIDNALIEYNSKYSLSQLSISIGKRNDRFNFEEFRLVKNVVSGEYRKGLKYYRQNIVESTAEEGEILRLERKANSLFEDENLKALFVLKQLFKSGRFRVHTHKFILRYNNLERSFRRNFSNYQNNVFEGSKGKSNKEDQGRDRSDFGANNYQKKPGLFKKMESKFSTERQLSDKNKSDKHYQQYLKVAKETQQKVITIPQFNFAQCKDYVQVANNFKSQIHLINSKNINSIIGKYSSVPFFGDITSLIVYFFFSLSDGPSPQGLLIEFKSSFGQISKDYGEYLKGCPFMFQLPDKIYQRMLGDKLNRKNFKRLVGHLLLHKNSFSDSLINGISNVCSKQNIGITFLEIIHLINARDIEISYEGLKKITSTIQLFSNMQEDLLTFTRQYCSRANIKIQARLFEPYIKNLTNSERYQALNGFFDILRQQFRVKDYQINKNLSNQQNLKAQKIYREQEAERNNAQIFQMVEISAGALKYRTKIPPFLVQYYNIYVSKKKGKLIAREYGVGLLLNSQNEQKFLEILEKVKKDPSENNHIVFQYQLKALSLFGRNLREHVEKILKATLISRMLNLNLQQLKTMGQIFYELDIPGAFSQYLEFILRTQPEMSPEIRSFYYKIFNNITDDFAKNQVSGFLDFIFNPKRLKEREEFKKVKEEEQRKSELLKKIDQKEKQPEEAKDENKKVEQPNAEAEKSKGKEKKKQKKEEKKKNKLEQEQKAPKKQLVEKVQVKKEVEVKGQGKKEKIELKNVNKILSVFSYDQNNKPVYHQKLPTIDKRRPALQKFISVFLTKPEKVNEQEQAKKGKKSVSVDQKDKKKGGKKQELKAKSSSKK